MSPHRPVSSFAGASQMIVSRTAELARLDALLAALVFPLVPGGRLQRAFACRVGALGEPARQALLVAAAHRPGPCLPGCPVRMCTVRQAVAKDPGGSGLPGSFCAL
jgi:hypothetical protein